MKTFGWVGGDEEGDCFMSLTCVHISYSPTPPRHDPLVNHLPTPLLKSSMSHMIVVSTSPYSYAQLFPHLAHFTFYTVNGMMFY